MANDHNEQKQLLIPDKLKVGYRTEKTTYSGKLGYVIYFNHKGELCKEKSWKGWVDKKLGSIDCDNEPTEGFVLNKGVGGVKESYGWNVRSEKVRVYDPRGFEIEISIPNLLFILREGACSPGKGLEGKFVYAWDRNSLILLPVASQDYQNCKSFTDLQSKGVHAKDLVDGASYITKKQDTLTYLGRFDYHFVLEMHYRSSRDPKKPYTLQPKTKADTKGQTKVYVFWDGKDFVYLRELKSLAIRVGDSIDADYANLIDKFNKSSHGSKVVKLFLKDIAESKSRSKDGYHRTDDPWYIEDEDGSFIQCSTQYERRWDHAQNKYANYKFTGVRAVNRYYINDDGVFTKEPCSSDYQLPKSTTPTTARLFAETENGSKIRVDKIGTNNYGYNTIVFAKEI